VPTPFENQEPQDQDQPKDLSQDEVQAIWAEEAASRAAAKAVAAGQAAPTPAEPTKTEPAATDKPDDGKPAATDKKDDKSPGEPKPAAEDEDPVAKRFSTLEQQLKRAEGRIAAMQREQAAAAKKVTEKVDVAPTQAQQAAAMKDPEKWTALKKDFPEWGEAIHDFLAANLPQGGPTAEDLAKQVASQVEALAAVHEVARIERKHPGWQDTVKTQDFIDWRAKQDERVNALGASDLSDDAIEMLDLFTRRNEKPTQDVKSERANRLAAAATTQRAARVAPTPRDDNELTPQEIWKQEAARRAKLRAEQAA